MMVFGAVLNMFTSHNEHIIETDDSIQKLHVLNIDLNENFINNDISIMENIYGYGENIQMSDITGKCEKNIDLFDEKFSTDSDNQSEDEDLDIIEFDEEDKENKNDEEWVIIPEILRPIVINENELFNCSKIQKWYSEEELTFIEEEYNILF